MEGEISQNCRSVSPRFCSDPRRPYCRNLTNPSQNRKDLSLITHSFLPSLPSPTAYKSLPRNQKSRNPKIQQGRSRELSRTAARAKPSPFCPYAKAGSGAALTPIWHFAGPSCFGFPRKPSRGAASLARLARQNSHLHLASRFRAIRSATWSRDAFAPGTECDAARSKASRKTSKPMGADLYIKPLYDEQRRKWEKRFEQAAARRDRLPQSPPAHTRIQQRVEL